MIKCLIVDDEPLAREVLEAYVKEIDELSLVASCKTAMEAKACMEKEPVDLLFLDINMPQISGINFYKTLVHKPSVIFTTAYPDYAVEGFELDAIDYLLKPFSFERFAKAVKKFTSKNPENHDFIMFKADKRMHKVDFDNILYFESIGDYVKVVLKVGKNLVIADTLKSLEKTLPSTFLRVHKSYIIAIAKLEYIEGNQIKLGEVKIPVGQSYREKLNKLFRK